MHLGAPVAALLLMCCTLPLTLHAQLVQDFNPPKGRCCLAAAAEELARELQDWNQLGRYYQEDQRVEKEARVAGRVVFLGDSITDIWNLKAILSAETLCQPRH